MVPLAGTRSSATSVFASAKAEALLYSTDDVFVGMLLVTRHVEYPLHHLSRFAHGLAFVPVYGDRTGDVSN